MDTTLLLFIVIASVFICLGLTTLLIIILAHCFIKKYKRRDNVLDLENNNTLSDSNLQSNQELYYDSVEYLEARN